MDLVEAILEAEFDPTLVEAKQDERKANAQRADRVGGMLLGVAVGDALGAPHEFRNQVPLARYTGKLEHPLWICRRFQGGKLTGNVGQITDDTEMTIALANAIVREGRYDRAAAAARYIAWANSRCTFMGKNTRALFVGVKTVAGYEKRWRALRAAPSRQHSQSNGCLMRASPLATLPEAEWEAAAAADCALTNFHPICVASVRAYVAAARELIAGGAPAAATARALAIASAAEDGVAVAAVIAAARDQEPRDVTANKGWVLHALHCAFSALNAPGGTYQDRIDAVVRRGGDTDTNGAIAGALLGAQLGEAAMRAEDRTGGNIAAVLGYDPAAGGIARPPAYAPGRIPQLARGLALLA